MRKSLLYTTGKSIACVPLILLLIASMTLVDVPRVRGQSTVLRVDPQEYEAPVVGHSFTVNVTIVDVSRLSAVYFDLLYNTTLLDGIACSLTPISEDYLADYVPAPWSSTASIFDDEGRISFGAVFKDPDDPFNGTGAVLTITFTATELGNCTLQLSDTKVGGISPYPDYTIYPIEHTVVDGSVTVVPEFPAAIVLPLLLIVTLAAAFLGKMFWSRKRKDIPTLNR